MLRLVLRESKRAWGCLEPSSSSWFSLVRPSTASLLTSRKSLLFASRKGFSTNEQQISTEEHINQPGAAGEDVAHKREATEKREEKEGKEKKERKQTKGESREKEDNENEGERIELSPEEQERLKRERELEYYTRAISRAGRAERHSEVFKYCMEMKQAGIKPNMVIMNAVIDSFASTRRIDSAFLMLDQLLEMGLTPNLKTLDALLKACDVHAESKRAIEVTEKMRNMNVWPDVYSHTCLTSIYAKTGEFERGWAEYEALKAVFSAIPTDILVNFFRQVLKHNNPEWTKTILEEMTTHDVNVSPSDYYKSLDIFLHGRHLGGSMIIYERFGDVLDEGTLVKLLELTARTKDRAFGARVFETIRRHTRGAPSKYAFNTLLYSAYASRDVVAFLDTVTAMVREGHKLGAAFVTMFARMCKTQEELDVAHNHLYKLGAEGNATVDVMDAVMHACAHSGDMQRALAVFSDCMQKFQLQPDIGSFNALIEACEKAKDLNSALGVMQQLSTSGVTPTNDTFRTLINTCVAVRDLERATVALSDMVQQGLQPTYQIYASLATLCAQVGEREQAGAILDAMRSSGMSPDDFLISEVQPIRKGRHSAPTSANPTWAPNPKFRDQHT